jgi:uncharacterized protein (DUF305 family)
MILTGAIVMYAVMYMSSYQFDHVTFSLSRVYMALAMGATMAVVMLGYMWNMYPSRIGNIGILAAGTAVLAMAVYLDRRQVLVEDVAFMRAMIPHHSMAITRSERAHISDTRVRDLADQIIESQREEIAEMKALIEALNGG